MTVALSQYVDTVDLPAEAGVSGRAVRSMLRTMARIGNDEGNFRYGLRGSRLATLTDYSLSVVRRAQRYLVDQGLLERVQTGGGRSSTHWRIVVHRLTGKPISRHTSSDTAAQQPGTPGTAQGHTRRMFLGRFNRESASSITARPPSPDVSVGP